MTFAPALVAGGREPVRGRRHEDRGRRRLRRPARGALRGAQPGLRFVRAMRLGPDDPGSPDHRRGLLRGGRPPSGGRLEGRRGVASRADRARAGRERTVRRPSHRRDRQAGGRQGLLPRHRGPRRVGRDLARAGIVGDLIPLAVEVDVRGSGGVKIPRSWKPCSIPSSRIAPCASPRPAPGRRQRRRPPRARRPESARPSASAAARRSTPGSVYSLWASDFSPRSNGAQRRRLTLGLNISRPYACPCPGPRKTGADGTAMAEPPPHPIRRRPSATEILSPVCLGRNGTHVRGCTCSRSRHAPEESGTGTGTGTRAEDSPWH